MFYNNLKVEKVSTNTWKLLDDLVYVDSKHGAIGVPVDYVTDFASVPRVPIVFDFLGEVGHAAATIHDYLYDYGSITKSECDAVFHRALRDDGIGIIRSFIMYSGVKLFGHWAFKKARSN